MANAERVLTKTERNLWNAIVAEALAHLKYSAYAMKALEEGHPEVGQVFQEVAGAETIHGVNHLRVVGDIKSSRENLESVISGESREFATLYPRMIREAMDEDRHDAAQTFAVAMDREIQHLESFSRSLEELNKKVAAEAAALRQQPAVGRPAEVAERRESPAPQPPTSYPKAVREVAGERQRVAAFGRIREVVFGAQDGVLSTAVLVTAVAAGVSDTTTIIIAGLAAALAGMISMGSGSYLGSKAQRDVYLAEIEKEAKELEENPAEELAELVFIYHQQGLSYRQAREMADHISSDKDLWLRTLVEKELGINPDLLQSPVKDGLTMSGAFIAGAAVPLVPYLLAAADLIDRGPAIVASVAAALTGLFLIGLGKGRLIEKSPLLQGLEVLVIGATASGIGYLLGEGISRLFA